MPTIEELLQQYLAAQVVKPAEPVQKAAEVEYVTPAMLQDALSGFAEQVAKAVTSQVAEQVEKAMPVTREAGAGRQGTEKNAVDPREDDPVQYLVAKSQAGTLNAEDKELIYQLTYALITDGMVRD